MKRYRKKRKKRMLSLVLTAACALFLYSGAVYAEGGKFKSVEAFFERIHILINGQDIPVSEDSMIYDGTVYVPLRNLEEVTGAKVDWDNEKRTVIIERPVADDQNSESRSLEKDRQQLPLQNQPAQQIQQGQQQDKQPQQSQMDSGLLDELANRNNEVLSELVVLVQNDDLQGIMNAVAAFKQLQTQAGKRNDKFLSDTFGQLAVSLEQIYRGLAEKNTSASKSGWDSFHANEKRLIEYLAKR